MFSSRTARSPFDFADLVCLRPKRGPNIHQPRFRLSELSAHFTCLPLKSQHLDFRDDFLRVQATRDFNLSIQQLEALGQPGFLLRDHIDVLRDLARAGLKHTSLGLNGARRRLPELFRERRPLFAGSLGLKAGNARSHRGAAFANLPEFRCKLGIVDIHQRLIFLNDRALLHQDGLDNAPFQGLHDLRLL